MSAVTARPVLAAALFLVISACSGSSGPDDTGILDPGQRDGADDPGSIDWGGHDHGPDGGPSDDTDVGPLPDGDTAETVGPSITCDNDEECPFGRPHCDAVKRVCVACLIDAQCGLDRVCKAGDCVDAPCTPDEKKCAGSVKKVCNHLGTGWTSQDCAPKDCFDGECQTCEPGSHRCEGNNLETCTQGGYYVFDQQCPGICYEDACHTCMPGKDACDGDTIVRCSDDGETSTPVEDCNPNVTGNVCQSGKCVSLCLDNLKLNTNIGCDYWAADLDQVDDGDADNSPYAVVVSNLNDKYAATVRITRWEGGQEVPQTTDASGVAFPSEAIPPGQLRIFFLPPRNLNLTTQEALAWHVTSTIPVVAYQFNPLENVGVFSNDASLLIPSNALGAKYTVMTWPERVGALRAYLAVVAVGTTPTTVSITSTTRTLAGTNPSTGAAIPAMSAGETRQFVLNPFDVLQIESDQASGDLTGSRVEADKPVAVFGGTQCSNVPDTRCLSGKCPGTGKTCSGECTLICCCDHLEEQLLPRSAWGKSYVAPMLWQRTKEPAFWRVVASEPDTHVTLSPAVLSLPPLQAGEFVEFESAADLSLSADKPVMVGQFMASSFLAAECGTCEGAALFFPGSCSNGMGLCMDDTDCCGEHPGDPSFLIMIPNEQFRAEYVFLVPNKYASDYLSVVAKQGVAVRLDGTPLDQASSSPAGGSGYVVYRTAIADGVHTLDADYPVMAYVYGYDTDVSYGYPAGANVVVINPAGL